MPGAAPLRTPQRAAVLQGTLPAPVGGLNTIDPGFAMPETDSPLLWNFIGAENGVRSRLGWKEWATGLGGPVRSIAPFLGSDKLGTADRLFAATAAGLWDVSASTTTPAHVVTYPIITGGAGDAISCVSVNFSGGHFLLLADEENGYYVYSEATGAWTKVVAAASAAWAAGAVYGAGAYVQSGGLTYHTTAGGTAGATAPAGTGTGINDGGVVWDYAPSIDGLDPASICFVMVWKARVWLVERNSGNAYWLDVGAMFGTAHPQPFGSQFTHGGDLRGLYSWTGDGGSGPDDRLVVISGGGDVVIYEGTDPAFANSFGIVGRFYVGGVPAGRRLATSHAGDLLILSSIGIVPVSRLGRGSPDSDRTQYATYKIGNLFNRLMAEFRDVRGWSMTVHPEDATLLLAVPQADDADTTQLAMDLQRRAWAQYRGLPLLSMDAWGGQLYFGTVDGRVCVNTGYIDGVLLSDPGAFLPIDCSGLTRFSNLGTGAQKQIMMIRPTIISEGGAVPSSFAARYRYDLSEAPIPIATAATSGTSTWDVAKWDEGKWAGAYVTQQRTVGATGMGPDAAVAFRLLATSRTVLVGFDLSYVVTGSMT